MFRDGGACGSADGATKKAVGQRFSQLVLSRTGGFMALFFRSDDVDEMILIKEAVAITENALLDLVSPNVVNAPRKRLNLHPNVGEGSFDGGLNIYAVGLGSYGAI